MLHILKKDLEVHPVDMPQPPSSKLVLRAKPRRMWPSWDGRYDEHWAITQQMFSKTSSAALVVGSTRQCRDGHTMTQTPGMPSDALGWLPELPGGVDAIDRLPYSYRNRQSRTTRLHGVIRPLPICTYQCPLTRQHPLYLSTSTWHISFVDLYISPVTSNTSHAVS